MNLIVNTRYNERRLTIFTSNYQDIPDDTDPNSLLFRIGYRMRSRLHEMCEFVEMDGADYRELPANGGVDDLVDAVEDAPKKIAAVAARRPPGARPAPRAGVRDGKADLKWPGGRAGAEAVIAELDCQCSASTSTSRSAPPSATTATSTAVSSTPR